MTNISLPDGVTHIGTYAFSECSGPTSFTIPASVTQIAAGTVSFCKFFSIIIPTNITCIGDYAFGYCALTNLTIPNSVTNLGNSVFSHSTLNNITIGATVGVTCIGSNMFERCTSLAGVT